MKLNKKVEIGINVISALRKREGFVTASEIAPEVGTTVNFLEQIMRNLKTSGLIEVKRGKNGGYALNKANTENITAYSVARAVGKLSEGLDKGDQSVPNQLRMSLVEAFMNTKI